MTKSLKPKSAPVSPASLAALKQLYQFLTTTQEQLRAHDAFKIVSFAQEIPPIDPLALLDQIAAGDRVHFYWENRSHNEAVLAYETAQSLIIDAPDRFTRTQQFIEQCRQQILTMGNPWASEPRFFCSFTFFAHSQLAGAAFPAATAFLPRYQVVRRGESCLFVANIALDRTINLTETVAEVEQQLQQVCSCKRQLTNLTTINGRARGSVKLALDNGDYFQLAVASALRSIRQQSFSKIVLASATDILSAEPFDITYSLNNLRQRYPDCYIFSVSNAQNKTFIGASPERLISIHNGQITTDALAGSAPRGQTPAEDAIFADRLLNSPKERREHQAVSNYICDRLQQLGLAAQQAPLQLLRLSNIQHLWTPIAAELTPGVHPLEIVAQLHPTPAVAGVPTPIACEQIRRYETFPRNLYAAPLGWIDAQGNSNFIVGIRSALIEGDRARLYAGAGVVAGSDPEREFAEVQLKLQSLLKSLV